MNIFEVDFLNDPIKRKSDTKNRQSICHCIGLDLQENGSAYESLMTRTIFVDLKVGLGSNRFTPAGS